MDFDYDLFISYAHEDAAWAQKVHGALAAKFKIFLDEKRLEAGRRWEPALLDALQRSKHLLVLWSDRYAKSDWSQQERGRFMQIIDPQGAGNPHRSIFVIFLQGDAPSMAGYQLIYDLRTAGAYPGDPEHVEAGLWTKVTGRIEKSASSTDTSIAIPRLLLTMTQAQLVRLDSTRNVGVGMGNLEQALERLGVGTKADLSERYRDSRTDWRPFGSETNVETLLDTVRDQLHQIFDDQKVSMRFHWEDVEGFWADVPAEFDAAIATLALRPSVVVVDPLALYDVDIANRFSQLNAVFGNARALVLVLAPFTLPDAIRGLRDLVRQLARRVFDTFYVPPLKRDVTVARCGPDVWEERDLTRWLLTVLGPEAVPWASDERPEYLKTVANARP